MPILIRPILWHLESSGVSLLGAVHFGPDGGFQLPSELLSQIDGADMVCFEIPNLDTPPSPTFLQRTSGTLSDDMSPELYAKLAKRYGSSYDNLTLSAISLVMGVNLYPPLGWFAENGLDVVLCRRLRANHRVVLGLETFDDQVAMINGTDKASLLHELTYCLDNPDLMQQSARGMVSAFPAGDIGFMDQQREFVRRVSPARAETMFDQRERKWITRIEQAIAAGGVAFFVVGAAHVAERGGVVSLLRARGHRVSRVG